MKPAASKPQLFQQPLSGLPIKVVFAYEDDAAFHAAMEIYRGVAGRLTTQFEFRDYCWRFDVLARPTLFERAADIAAETDVVFCCPGNPHVLPRLVQEWIQQWITRRTHPEGALALLLPVSAENFSYPTLLERDLRETARVGGLAFFATNYLVKNFPHPASSPAQSPVVVGEDLDIVCLNEHGADMRHWGINE